jgi:AcrR family transcriptional regulator
LGDARTAGLHAGPAARASVRRRLIEASMDAIAWRGLVRFSMTEVSRAAKVSRQTLYRYFPSKKALLTGLTEHLRQQIEEGMIRTIEADPSVEGRLMAVSNYNVHPDLRRRVEVLIKAESEFMLRVLGAYHDNFRRLLVNALGPLFDTAEEKHGVVLDRALVAETVMRLRMSVFLLPPADDLTFTKRAVQSLLSCVLEQPGTWAMEPAQALHEGTGGE